MHYTINWCCNFCYCSSFHSCLSTWEEPQHTLGVHNSYNKISLSLTCSGRLKSWFPTIIKTKSLRFKELIILFRNPCYPFEFGYTCMLTPGDWATVVFTFVLFAINHTSHYTIPITEDTLLPSKTEALLFIKQKVSHKMENVSGDLWYAPAIFMLRGRSRHWGETVCHSGGEILGLSLMQWLHESLLAPCSCQNLPLSTVGG